MQWYCTIAVLTKAFHEAKLRPRLSWAKEKPALMIALQLFKWGKVFLPGTRTKWSNNARRKTLRFIGHIILNIDYIGFAFFKKIWQLLNFSYWLINSLLPWALISQLGNCLFFQLFLFRVKLYHLQGASFLSLSSTCNFSITINWEPC